MEQITTIPIEHIRPDPEQPRCILPRDLANALAAGAAPSDILTQLRARAERDKRRPELVEGWIRERLAELDALADSIASDGLLQPIRVIRDGDVSYRIEEGERRWWAHHILVVRGDARFQVIPAIVLEKEGQKPGLLRRRVAENVLRSDFTAIELARAMANRIQEIVTAEPGLARREAEERVGKENGMSDRRVRQYVALLTLSPEVQDLAQQARLSENALRRLVGIKNPARQIAAARELIQSSREKSSDALSRRFEITDSLRLMRDDASSRAKSRAQKRAKASADRARRVRAKRKPTGALRKRDANDTVRKTVEHIRQLVSLAKALRRDRARVLQRKLWEQAVAEKANRRALAHLRDLLNQKLDDAAPREGARRA